MAQANQGGRPFGPVRAESPEAEELADFLRHLVATAGRTVADVARTVGRAPGTVSGNLSGRVPTEQFVRALVAATTRDPRDLRRALNLLRAARNPAPPHVRPGGLPGGGLPGGSVEEQHGYLETLYNQLGQAKEQRDELQLALVNTEKIVTVLLIMLATLQHRVGELTEERNRLLGHRQELARLLSTQQQLVDAHDRERRAMDELLRAETRRTEVEGLLSQVLDQMGRLTERVALLQDTDGGQPGGHRTDLPLAPAESTGDPLGEDIDRALERLGAINEEGDRTVRRLADAWDARTPAPLEPAPAHTGPSANGRVLTFYSYKGGSGRTTVTANCAWILAANGLRVLAVDWNLAAPGLHHYFHPFLEPEDTEAENAATGGRNLVGLLRRSLDTPEDGTAHPACVLDHVRPLRWPGFPGDGRLDLLPAGDVLADGTDALLARAVTEDVVEAVGQDLRHHYDYILIDAPSGLSDTADLCTVRLPDDLVLCFTLGRRSVDEAARVARTVHQRDRDEGVRVLPVPTRVDQGEAAKAEAGRAHARQRFDGLPAGLTQEELSRYWGSVELPYRPFYAFESVLASFGDEPGLNSTMLASFERLVAVLTDGRVSALPPVDEELRLRYLAAFTHRRPAVPEDIALSYVDADQTWAEWIRSVLTRAGLLVRPDGPRPAAAQGRPTLPAGSGAGGGVRTVAVLSDSSERARWLRESWESWEPPGSDPSGRQLLVPVRVGDIRLGAATDRREPVDLVGRDEPEAVRALLAGLGLGDAPPPAPDDDAPRFPARRPILWNAPHRNRHFIGRSTILDRMRERFGGGDGKTPASVQVLVGLGGIGKTQIAVEYTHRFLADYDLVWWIDAEQSDLVTDSLAELAHRLGLRTGESLGAATEAARDALRRGEPTSRWLLVLDNVDTAAEIARHLPDGPGHVLITSRHAEWPTWAEEVEVDVFGRAESVEHLTARIPGVSPADAERVAEAVADLPLAVEVAAAWLAETATPVDDYVAQLRDASARMLALNTPVDYPAPAGATWNISLARLRDRSPAAARLLQLCAFLAAEPIAMRLVHGDEMVRALVPYDADLGDPMLLGSVLQAISRLALAKVEPGGHGLQIHRLVRAAVRATLDEEEQRTTRHAAHLVLAGARPAVGDTEDPANWPAYETIWPHLMPSGAHDCDDPGTRLLLIDRIRYLRTRGDLDAALQLGRTLDAHWTAKLGEDDRQTLLLRFHLAGVLRSRGDYADALALDEAVLERQRRGFGEHHPYTLLTAGSLAADRRATGRFDAALELDRETLEQLREEFGANNALTLAMANDLALDHRLTGDFAIAHDLDRDTFERRATALGTRHPATLVSRANWARGLRDLGHHRSSLDVLGETLAELRGILDEDAPECLDVADSLAVGLRLSGRTAEARQLSETTYRLRLERHGPDTPGALASALNLAAALGACGEHTEAVDLAGDTHEKHRALFGRQHPFTFACAANLALYRRRCGESDQAVRLGDAATRGLADTVGPDHPSALTARLTLANSYAVAGDHERAEEEGRAALGGLSERYGDQHPDTVLGRANLAVTLRHRGRHPEAAELWAGAESAIARLLGETHPHLRAVRAWQQVDRDLEPQPF
ncbi:FxSxx-COOH system tetratricopeptide repeat protein [Kitasatospora sp. NPDC094019]|uniref:FxSxx-COOH system tetratricopeptide repeat protein n=1 Tax=Kitasatospora sp. NPDC094019 TaxID=3364091 RepID=UPI0038224FFF